MASAPGLRAEISRRDFSTSVIWTLFQSNPNAWLHWRRFAKFAPCAWRSRISDARKQAKKHGGQIVWNGRTTRSAYRYIPAASEPSPHLWPVVGAPAYEEPFELKAENQR